MIDKALFLFFLMFGFYSLNAQTISGYVYDDVEKKPLEGALVYLDGTTLKTNTDANGFFSLTSLQDISGVLVVSYLGYQNYLLNNPFANAKPVSVILKENITKLDEVVINKTKGPFSRKEMLKAFREQFLGQSAAGSSCKILNEKDIYFDYDPTTRILKAMTIRPLQIINKQLKYTLVFDLAGFEVAYKTKSLNSAYINTSFFAGTTFFTDTSEKGNADKKRKAAYQGSQVHFLKALTQKQLKKEKYDFYVDKLPDDPEKYFIIKDTLNVKKVTVVPLPEQQREVSLNSVKYNPERSKYHNMRYTFLHDKKNQSFLNFNKGVFYVDENGLFGPVTEVMFGGYMGNLKAGDMLPADYKYTE